MKIVGVLLGQAVSLRIKAVGRVQQCQVVEVNDEPVNLPVTLAGGRYLCYKSGWYAVINKLTTKVLLQLGGCVYSSCEQLHGAFGFCSNF
ncbi:IgGFc-binding protein-like protein [Lates japonicus]|uniref:IgGFc-binding protein-like protein n=1 Tax=Lates japonicus TaxID=270547 RepID=A0AAD3RCN7_LATJO|nr:IgGFc-binding protein-like protein [Lates japonicus]